MKVISRDCPAVEDDNTSPEHNAFDSGEDELWRHHDNALRWAVTTPWQRVKMNYDDTMTTREDELWRHRDNIPSFPSVAQSKS